MAEVSIEHPIAGRVEEASGTVGHFDIVPVRAIPAVLIVLIGLVVSIATNTLWAIDFYHVVAGGMWTTMDLFLGFVLGPFVMARMTPPARAELVKRLMPKLLLAMPTLVICTLAAGWQLARRLGNLDSSFDYHSWIVVSMIVVAVMTIVALGVLEPANIAVLLELRKDNPRPDVIATLVKRFVFTAAITGTMQVITLVIMTRLATI
jgi:hypothetical protein